MEKALADGKSDLEDYKSRLKQLRAAPGAKLATGTPDADYMTLKFEDWKRKMLCITCRTHENDVVLTCGHMSCNDCIEESFNSRQRCCPVDRKKISRADVIRIFWNGLSGGADEQL